MCRWAWEAGALPGCAHGGLALWAHLAARRAPPQPELVPYPAPELLLKSSTRLVQRVFSGNYVLYRPTARTLLPCPLLNLGPTKY